MLALVFAIVGYLFGSISSAIMVCRMMGLGDPRQSGSGNPGATNVLRLGGKPAAIFTLSGDVLKGILPVVVAALAVDDSLVVAAAALGSFLGHLYPLYFSFQGGKGVATAIGVYLGIDLLVGFGVIATWLAVAGLTRLSSVSSLAALLLAPVIGWLVVRDVSIVVVAAVIFVFAAIMHRSNIVRLLAGEESKIELKR